MLIRHTIVDTSIGELTLVGVGSDLTGVYFSQHWHRPKADTLGPYVQAHQDDLFHRTANQLDEYLSGRRTSFDLPIAMIGESHQVRVWELLNQIGYGQTTTYGALAATLADGTTAYEVGQVVGRNPLSIVVPCHRVIGKNGALTGYAGGLQRKRLLLDLEEPAPALAGRLF